MANEYQTLATINDEDYALEIKRVYREDGGRGYEVVIWDDSYEVSFKESFGDKLPPILCILQTERLDSSEDL